MRILVIGGNGFIGRAVVRKLAVAGHHVAIADDFSTSDVSVSHPDGVVRFKVDIVNADELNSIDFSPELVIHLAFPTSKCNRDPRSQFEVVASTGMLNVLNYTKDTCNRIIYASSISVYGIPIVTPITEQNEVRPILIYGANKFMNEQYLHCYHLDFGLDYNIIRVSDTFGEHDRRSNAVNNFIKAFIGDQPLFVNGTGQQKRTFTYVEDIAEAFVLGISSLHNTVYNVASRHSLSIIELIAILESEFGKSISVNHHDKSTDVRNYSFDCAKFEEHFGSFEQVGFIHGLRRTISHLQNRAL